MENQKGSSDGEDIPSDFFDDFAKEDFIEGLSVIDSWNDDEKKSFVRSRINAEALDKVDDLRDLIIREGRERYDNTDNFKWSRNEQSQSKTSNDQRRSGSISRLDNYIKPGSRRDPNKTNEAIKKDKEEKVKEYLAKHLESNAELCPPGTELDDFYENKTAEVKKRPIGRPSIERKRSFVSPPKERRASATKHRRDSPIRRKESPRYRSHHWSPRPTNFTGHNQRPRSPRRSPRRSPWRSPRRSAPRSPRRFSPKRNFRRNYRNSPRRYSPELRRRKSRSPMKRPYRRSRSRSPNFRDRQVRQRSRSLSRNRILEKDDFLYPKNYYPPPEFSTIKNEMLYSTQPAPQYTAPVTVEYPEVPSFSYAQESAYTGYNTSFQYGVQPAPAAIMPGPQPVSAPNIQQPQPIVSPAFDITPVMVPPPQQMSSPIISNAPLNSHLPETVQKQPPTDALAKLVADGKLSHEDYLKLAPYKGVTHMDTQAKVAVLNRCNTALSKLGNIMLPNKLVINNQFFPAGSEQKQITPKFCSPLKRQTVMDFHFTMSDASTIRQRNKQIVETVVAAFNLESIVGKPKKKVQKDMKDAAVQTIKPFCDVCEIRESTQFSDAGTSIDRERISSTVHTQVVEKDMISSKTVFNPSGSVTGGAPISIAHMTPAQLVSQLAARAKTLKQTDSAQPSSQFRKPHNSYNYDGRGGGGNQYHGNNYNYRY